MTLRFPTHQIGAGGTTRRSVTALLVTVGVLVSGACSGNEADGDRSADVSGATVPDENRPALEPSDEADTGADTGADDAESSTVTAAPSDPAIDAVDDSAVGERGALEEVVSSATDPVTGNSVSDLEAVTSGLPETWDRNSSGAEIRLDEAAQLACANAQIGLVRLGELSADAATGHLAVAAVRADQSAVAEIHTSANGLALAALNHSEAGAAEAFVQICVDRGYEG